MPTLFKNRGNTTTATRIKMEELVEMIRGQKYGGELQTYREVWPLQKVSRMDDAEGAAGVLCGGVAEA